MKKLTFIALAFTLTFPVVPTAVGALGISIAPPTLALEAVAGKEAVARFTVKNPTSEVALYEAYPEEFEDFITLVPSRFVLEAGEKREVTVRARSREESTIRTALAVEARPLGEPALGVGGGVRVPFSLTVLPQGGLFAAVSASGAARGVLWFFLGALTVLFLVRRVSLSTLKARFRKSTL